MQASVHQPIFTVYLTSQGIELHPGCEDYPYRQALHSCKSFELAYEFAQMAAACRNLPLQVKKLSEYSLNV
ncbi:hypothetical protein ACN4EK_14650 [Pantanalinema rosaneae CENA516]|uniref:hypothetical protein n=1 Tax=Pantanalinema rosaneae TaxID=1620701 RepID=UPI003D6EF8EB